VDQIQVRGLRILGTHGALPEEQDRAQPFEVDVDLDVDLSLAGESDALGDTVDYGVVVSIVQAVVRDEHFQLIEALAERIASAVLGADDRIGALAVTVRKLHPPVPADLGHAAVRIER
jgi:dihydroneopterin aldolase